MRCLLVNRVRLLVNRVRLLVNRVRLLVNRVRLLMNRVRLVDDLEVRGLLLRRGAGQAAASQEVWTGTWIGASAIICYPCVQLQTRCKRCSRRVGRLRDSEGSNTITWQTHASLSQVAFQASSVTPNAL
jgi:hypothetical protein